MTAVSVLVLASQKGPTASMSLRRSSASKHGPTVFCLKVHMGYNVGGVINAQTRISLMLPS